VNVFERIVCGIDGTPAAVDGARQAAALAEDGGRLLFVTVTMEASVAAVTAAGTGMVVPPPVDEDEGFLARDLALVKAEFPTLAVEAQVLQGPIVPTIVHALEEQKATLAAVGRHGHSRLAGLVLGSVATALLHDAPCSVLVAGPREKEAAPFPDSIVVGFDGSEQAEQAARVAAELARRKESSIQAVCATGGKEIDVDTLQARLTEIAPGVALAVIDGKPDDVLAGQSCDLVVVGNRGLHGLKAVGSVSEKVAHHADCSVLVVRS